MRGVVRRSRFVVRGSGSTSVVLALIAAVSYGPTRPLAAGDPAVEVDAIFAKYTATTPGCAVGVAVDGAPILAKGYGMADLEHDVRIAPESIFEAGSVSKQFTAAAVLILAR